MAIVQHETEHGCGLFKALKQEMSMRQIRLPRHSPRAMPWIRLAAGLLLISFYSINVGAQTVDESFNLSSDYQNSSFCTIGALQPDGKILTCIPDEAPHGQDAPSIRMLRFNADGSIDRTFNNPILPHDVGFIGGANRGSAFNTLAVLENGKILAGGFFGILNRGLVQLNADGTVDELFIPEIPAGRNVVAIVVQPDGRILLSISTSWWEQGGEAYHPSMVIRLNANGTRDNSFQMNQQAIARIVYPGIDFRMEGNQVETAAYSIALQGDGKILLGGEFRRNVPSDRNVFNSVLARLNTDGTVDDSFNVSAYASEDHSVGLIVLMADGKILYKRLGWGSQIGVSHETSRIYRFNADGSADPSYRLSDSYNEWDFVNPKGLQADGKIIVGVTNTFGRRNNFYSRVNSDGSRDENFLIGGDGQDLIRPWFESLQLQADGKILMFRSGSGPINIDGRMVGGPMFRLNNNGAALQSHELGSSFVVWRRSGVVPEFSRVVFERSDDGINYTFLGHGSRMAGSNGWELTGIDLSAGSRVRGRGFYTNGSIFNASSIAEYDMGRLLRTLCSDPQRSQPPCRRVAVRVFRYRNRPDPGPVRIQDALVNVMNAKGEIQTLVADKLGDYVFEDAMVGETYHFDIKHADFQFKSENVKITEDMKELEFTAQE